jgi:DNA-binding IclR family transcriptional regulator
VEILFAFSEKQPRRTATELSTDLGIPIPSVHRYVALLRQMGLVADTRKGLYQLTPRIFSLSRAVRTSNTLLDIARPHLTRLSAELDESVLLVQFIAGAPVCIDRYESSQTIRPSFQPGQSLPPLRGASAKVLLGGLSRAERDAYVLQHRRHAGSSSAQVDWERQAALAGERGWATSSAEVNEGVWAAAAAVRDNDHVVAAISVACPAYRLTHEDQANILRQVISGAQGITDAVSAQAAGYLGG